MQPTQDIFSVHRIASQLRRGGWKARTEPFWTSCRVLWAKKRRMDEFTRCKL